MGSKVKRGKGIRRLTGLLFLLLVFSLGVLSGMYVEHNNLFGKKEKVTSAETEAASGEASLTKGSEETADEDITLAEDKETYSEKLEEEDGTAGRDIPEIVEGEKETSDVSASSKSNVTAGADESVAVKDGENVTVGYDESMALEEDESVAVGEDEGAAVGNKEGVTPGDDDTKVKEKDKEDTGAVRPSENSPEPGVSEEETIDVEKKTKMYPVDQLDSPEKTSIAGYSEASARDEGAEKDVNMSEGASKMPDSIDEKAQAVLNGMSIEDKVAQLFFVTPDALTNVSGATQAGNITKDAFDRRPVGGIILFEGNISGPEQLKSFTEGLSRISKERLGIIPFIAVDEEGGTVLRVAKNGSFGLNATRNMSDIGTSGSTMEASSAGSYIGSYLAEYGINVDFAPVADVVTNPDNTVVRYRSFGGDSELTAEMVASYVEGLNSYGILATLKHFPGHGSTSSDSHKGAALSYRTEEELETIDLLPFVRGIKAGADFVMAGHIRFPNIETGEDVPATLSHYFLSDVLRDRIGFEGIAITDGMNMKAITDYYSSGEAAVAAINAGADMVLMPASFGDAYSEVLSAVNRGVIPEERVNESVMRILKVKLRKMDTAE